MTAGTLPPETDRHAAVDTLCSELNGVHFGGHDVGGDISKSPHKDVMEDILKQNTKV